MQGIIGNGIIYWVMVMENDELEMQASDPGPYNKKTIDIPRYIIKKEAENELLNNLAITWTGCYENAKGHFVRNRVLNEYVLIYCTGGKGWLEMAGKRWVINTGDVFFCFKDIRHSYGADDQDPWTKYWVCFIGKSVPDFLSLLQVSPQSPVIPIGDKSKLFTLFYEIFETLSYGYSLNNLLYASSCVHQILSYLFNVQMYTYKAVTKDINIEKIVRFMYENINNSFTLKELADYANMSKYYFLRKFKEKTGYSPIDYFNRLKIQKACELLDASAVRISEISQMLGFNSQYYFSLTFKKIIGYSPRTYREIRRG